METVAPKTGPHGCPSEDFDQLLDDLCLAGSTFQMDFSAAGFGAAELRSVSSVLDMDISTNLALSENATDPFFLDGFGKVWSQPSSSDLLMGTSTKMFCDARQTVVQKRSHELTTRPAISQYLLQASSQLSHSNTMPRHERPREARQYRATQTAKDLRAFGSALYPDGCAMADNDMLPRSQLRSSIPSAGGLTPILPYSLGTPTAQSALDVANTSSVTNMTPFASAVSLGLSISQSVAHPLQQNQHDELLQNMDSMSEMVAKILQQQKQGRPPLHTLSLPAMQQDGYTANPHHHLLSLPVSTQELCAALPTGLGAFPTASSTQTSFMHALHQQTTLLEQQQAVIRATASDKLQLQHQQVLWAATAALQQQTAAAMATSSDHSLSPTHSLSPHRSLSPNHSFTTHHTTAHQSSPQLSPHNSVAPLASCDATGLAQELRQQQMPMAQLTPKSPGSEPPSQSSQHSDHELGQQHKVARFDSSDSLQPSAAQSQLCTLPASPPGQASSPPRPETLLISHHSSPSQPSSPPPPETLLVGPHSSPSVFCQPGSPQSSGQTGAASGTVQHTCTSCRLVSSAQQAESVECSTPIIAEQPRSPASMLMDPISVESSLPFMPLMQPDHTFPHQSRAMLASPQFLGSAGVAMVKPISSIAQQMPGGGFMLTIQLPISYADLLQLSSATGPMNIQAPVSFAPLLSGKLLDFEASTPATPPVGSPPLQHMLPACLQQKVDGLQQGLESLELHHRKLHAELKKEDMHLLNGTIGATQDVKNLKQQICEVVQRHDAMRAGMQQLVEAHNSMV